MKRNIIFKFFFFLKLNLNRWILLSLGIILLIICPLIYIIVESLTIEVDSWLHIINTVLKTYVFETFVLLIGVCIFSLLFGIIPAWLVSVYDFPLRKIFSTMLIFPFAIPSYICAYVYKEIFEYQGYLSELIYKITGIDNFYLDIMNIWGAIFIFTITLYPYIYLNTRFAFSYQGASILEFSRLVSKKRWYSFLKIAIPLSRYSIIGGLILVLMELLNDYGVSHYYGVSTLTIGIFRAWFSFNNLTLALQLALILMLIILLIIFLEKILLRKRQYNHEFREITRKKIKKKKYIFILWSILFIPIFLGFIFPLIQLIDWTFLSFNYWSRNELNSFVKLIKHTFILGFIISSITVIISIILSYSFHLRTNFLIKYGINLVNIGYALLIVLIVIILFFLKFFNINYIDLFLKESEHNNYFLFYVLFFTIIIFRFLAIAYYSIYSGFTKVTNNLIQMSRLLGKGPLKTLLRILIPLNNRALIISFLLVFIVVVKELPLKAIISFVHIFDLNVKILIMINEGRVIKSSFPALLVIMVSLIGIFILDSLFNLRKKNTN